MSDTTFTVELPNAVASEIERLAKEQGVSPADFVAQAAVARVGSVDVAAAYFANRNKRAKAGTAKQFFSRGDGEKPAADDQVE